MQQRHLRSFVTESTYKGALLFLTYSIYIMDSSYDFPTVGNYCFQLDIEGWPLKVSYQYYPFKGDNFQGFHIPVNDDTMHHVHFEFRGRTASETGYRSHFCFVKELVRDPYTSAWLIAQGFYKILKKQHPKLIAREVQLSIF